MAVALLIIFGGGYLFSGYFSDKGGNKRIEGANKVPKFRKDATLTFSKPSDSTYSKVVDIEIADEEWEITQGLMYRPSMAPNAGMLFIFDNMEPRSFWMRNTIIPLDILFITDQKEIITIQKHTVPYSEQSVPSYKPAQYVLELNAGFADEHNIKEGDFIDWK